MVKAIDLIMQLFTNCINGREIIGTMGALQFGMILYRLKHKYNAIYRWEPIAIHKSTESGRTTLKQPADFKKDKHVNIVTDKHRYHISLVDTSYALQLVEEKLPDINLASLWRFKKGRKL